MSSDFFVGDGKNHKALRTKDLERSEVVADGPKSALDGDPSLRPVRIHLVLLVGRLSQSRRDFTGSGWRDDDALLCGEPGEQLEHAGSLLGTGFEELVGVCIERIDEGNTRAEGDFGAVLDSDLGRDGYLLASEVGEVLCEGTAIRVAALGLTDTFGEEGYGHAIGRFPELGEQGTDGLRRAIVRQTVELGYLTHLLSRVM